MEAWLLQIRKKMSTNLKINLKTTLFVNDAVGTQLML